MTDDELERRITEAEATSAKQWQRRAAAIEDYRFDKAQCAFWDLKANEMFRAESVDNSIPTDAWRTREAAVRGGGRRLVRVKPSEDIARIENGFMVDGSTWWPGKPQFIRDWLVSEAGWMRVPGSLLLNTYVPPDHAALDAQQRTPDRWIDHVKTLYPEPVEHEHFFDYAAHLLQRPTEKANHGIVLSGTQGIGKDSMLKPLVAGVGEWNHKSINPDDVESRFCPWMRNIMLVVNEVRPFAEEHRASSFYNRLKPILAAPPELLTMELKYAHPIPVRNVMRVFLTTNDYLTMHIPREDRRLFVMHSQAAKGWGGAAYFPEFWAYLNAGGNAAVIQWLLRRDIRSFDPYAEPPMTWGKRNIITSNAHVRRSPLHDAFEALVGEGERPPVVFPKDLLDAAFDDRDKVDAALKSKSLTYTLDHVGYVLYENPTGTERWLKKRSVGGAQHVFRSRSAFVRKDAPQQEWFDLVHAAMDARLDAITGAAR